MLNNIHGEPEHNGSDCTQSTVLYSAIKELRNSSSTIATIFISSLMPIDIPPFSANFHLITVVPREGTLTVEFSLFLH